MADKQISEKKDNRNSKNGKKTPGKVGAFFTRTGKGLKKFFSNLKAELKRVIWPDKKRLIQSTATVLFICLAAAIILFVVDTLLNTVLEGVGFYSPDTKVPAVTDTVETGETTAAETTAAETTAADSEETSEGA
ncbi:MAG: preprotein translocase subunit SecE [Eubacteriales bacterium]|jgi:preprotein translocase subunit SecE|nr:preprotein translocase subunit SecE [Eubacteriales bacterium]MDD3196894.1 preprotein translocase subunit SecE [Eubacteriales bacterium]MDD3502799.1 preprotein translocase subunit SecE [Eubacteriales bacterium]MDD4682491.1 preprotein translocase subunit SecE [Eubacteriales bacterium]